MIAYWKGAVALLLVVLASGCRTLRADPDDWTRVEALSALRGHYPEILEVKDTSITVPDPRSHWWKKRSLVIPFSDIESVRVVPEGKWFVVWIFTAGIYGPLVYDLEVILKNGMTVPLILHCRWGLGFTPLWIYPNILIHGYGTGYALDWLRQNAEADEVEPPR